jgi:hypothetical protein
MGQESFRSDGQQKEFKVARLKPVWWGVINVALAAIILLIEPDSIGDAVDEYSYAVFSQTVGAPLYPASRVDDIGVILLDDESLAGLKSSWPAVYGLHAKVLRKLLTAKPKALFIDFTFRDRRAAAPQGVLSDEWMPELYVHDDSLTMLVSTLQMYQMMDIPVYLQAGALNFYQHHAVLSELAPYVTLVSGWGDLQARLISGHFHINWPLNYATPGALQISRMMICRFVMMQSCAGRGTATSLDVMFPELPQQQQRSISIFVLAKSAQNP